MSPPTNSTTSLPLLRKDLAVCQRELSFARAELRETRNFALRAEEERHSEVAELQQQVHSLRHRIVTAYRANCEEGAAVQLELDARRRELSHVRAEAEMAHGESQLANFIHCSARENWLEAESMTARAQELQAVNADMRQSKRTMDLSIHDFRTKLSDSIAESERLWQGVTNLEGALEERMSSVAAYESRAQELHLELGKVVRHLRTRHESQLAERLRLADQVAGLERDVSMKSLTRTRSAASASSCNGTPRSLTTSHLPPAGKHRDAGAGNAPPRAPAMYPPALPPSAVSNASSCSGTPRRTADAGSAVAHMAALPRRYPK